MHRVVSADTTNNLLFFLARNYLKFSNILFTLIPNFLSAKLRYNIPKKCIKETFSKNSVGWRVDSQNMESKTTAPFLELSLCFYNVCI